jgi:hypothetical protein
VILAEEKTILSRNKAKEIVQGLENLHVLITNYLSWPGCTPGTLSFCLKRELKKHLMYSCIKKIDVASRCSNHKGRTTLNPQENQILAFSEEPAIAELASSDDNLSTFQHLQGQG